MAPVIACVHAVACQATGFGSGRIHCTREAITSRSKRNRFPAARIGTDPGGLPVSIAPSPLGPARATASPASSSRGSDRPPRCKAPAERYNGRKVRDALAGWPLVGFE